MLLSKIMSADHRFDRRAVRYEARATVMFGAYSVWATYADGSSEAVAHGTPQYCLTLAERLNRELGRVGKPLFDGDTGSFPPGDRATLAGFVRQCARPNSRMAEIGSWLGTGSTQVFIEVLDAFPGAELICVDHWRGSDTVSRHQRIVAEYDVFGTFLRNIERPGSSTKVTPLRRGSTEAACLIEDGALDLVFIDADHGYVSVKEDIAAWRPKVRKGGILCGHDCEMRVNAENREWLQGARDNDAIEVAGLPFAHVHAGVVLAVDEAFQGGARLCAERASESRAAGPSCIWWVEL